VLVQLSTRNKYGLELVDGSDGLLTREGVYVILSRMAAKKLIAPTAYRTASAGESGPPRRLYQITETGRRALAAYAAWTAA
jgi:DNA-binding PadR family transcriptional regulator